MDGAASGVSSINSIIYHYMSIHLCLCDYQIAGQNQNEIKFSGLVIQLTLGRRSFGRVYTYLGYIHSIAALIRKIIFPSSFLHIVRYFKSLLPLTIYNLLYMYTYNFIVSYAYTVYVCIENLTHFQELYQIFIYTYV